MTKCKCNSTRSSSRSEEHTSELQSHLNLVCPLLLEKKHIPTHHHQRQPSAPHTDSRRMRVRSARTRHVCNRARPHTPTHTHTRTHAHLFLYTHPPTRKLPLLPTTNPTPT